MPLKVKKIGNKYRLVEPSGRIARTSKGNPIDGGGHKTRKEAAAQIGAIESNEEEG